ncbi:MAG: LON peptidase substrate-binding domain-containing protein [Trueperaceae bacterium]
MDDLPLFPLPDTVVFPGMTVPLHIFEERYKRLVRTVVDSEPKRFVIALAPNAEAIRDLRPPLPHYGSFVDLLSVEENDDGSFNVLAHGQERCRLEIIREESVAEPEGSEHSLYYVEDLPEPVEREDPNQERLIAWDAVDTFRAYAATFFAFDALGQIEDSLPEDPIYQASFICANIRVPAASRQVLLDAPTLSSRFQLARKLMQERLDGHRPAADDAVDADDEEA